MLEIKLTFDDRMAIALLSQIADTLQALQPAARSATVTTAVTSAEEAAPEPVSAEPAPIDPPPAAPPPADPPADPPVEPLTLEQVRRAMADLDKVVGAELVQSFGASRLTLLDPEHYPALMERVKELTA